MGKFGDMKEVIEFAIEKEQEAADFYVEASKQEYFSGSRDMLVEFSKEELKHLKMLEEMRDKGIVQGVADYKLKWITDIKRSDYVADIDYKPGMAYKDMLMVAIKREEKALKLYNELLAQAEGAQVQKFFKILCQEEASHKLKLETMYDDHMAEMGD